MRTMANKLVVTKSDLERTLAVIKLELGNGSIMRLGDASHVSYLSFWRGFGNSSALRAELNH